MMNTPITVNPLVDNGNGPDEDPEGDPLTVVSAGPADVGTAVLNDDGTVTYTPDPRQCEMICKSEEIDHMLQPFHIQLKMKMIDYEIHPILRSLLNVKEYHQSLKMILIQPIKIHKLIHQY